MFGKFAGLISALALLMPIAATAEEQRRTAREVCQDLSVPSEAAASCETVLITGDPSAARFAWAWNNLGLARAAEGDYMAALDAYGKALVAEPRFAAALSNRGNAHAALGDMMAAKADHEAALELDPDYIAARHNLAVDLEELGDYEGALTAYREVLRRDSTHRGAQVGLATATCKLGRVKASAEARAAAIYSGALDPTEMQVLLKDEGFYKGPIDGLFGKGSRAALWAWTRTGCLAPA